MLSLLKENIFRIKNIHWMSLERNRERLIDKWRQSDSNVTLKWLISCTWIILNLEYKEISFMVKIKPMPKLIVKKIFYSI